jgi:hypothetical protein
MQYYIYDQDQQKGPYTEDQIRSMWSNGRVTAGAHYFRDGMPDWQPIGDLVQQFQPPTKVTASLPQTSNQGLRQHSCANPALILLGIVLLLGGPGVGYYLYSQASEQVESAQREREDAFHSSADDIADSVSRGDSQGVMKATDSVSETQNELDTAKHELKNSTNLAYGIGGAGILVGIGLLAAGSKRSQG